MNLSRKGVRTLSLRERVAAEQPGEGVRSRPNLQQSFEARMRRPLWTCAGDVDRLSNLFDDPIEPFLHLVIREANFNIAVSFDQLSACCVPFKLIEMMLAVDFDRQPKIEATKIRDKSCDGYLPTEFQSIESAATELLPSQIFGRRALCAKASRDADQTFGHRRQFGYQSGRSQPVTRLLRSHPLPQGEDL